MDKTIDYTFFHWGPFLYRTAVTEEEINLIKNLCSKKNKDVRKTLAGMIKHEHEVDRKKLFPIMAPYLESYIRAFHDYNGAHLGNKMELISAWVNYMTKFEYNPSHTHEEDLSFVLFLQVPKGLKKEISEYPGNAKPGALNFTYTLNNKKELINSHIFFPNVGELFIFPSCLHHDVNSFQSEGERISVSGNIKITNG